MAKTELTPAQQAFIDALIDSKGNVAAAAEAAGISYVYAYRLSKQLKDEILDAARSVLALNASRAAFTLVDGLDPENPVASTRVESAKQILDRVGIIKEDKLEVKTELPGVFILPSKKEE